MSVDPGKIAEARAQGYSDTEIAKHLAGEKYQEALGSGYTDSDIINFYLPPLPALPPEPAELTTPPTPEPPKPGIGDYARAAGEAIVGLPKFVYEHRIKPIAGLPKLLKGREGMWEYATRGLEQTMADNPEMPVSEALDRTIRQNIADLVLTGFDIGALFVTPGAGTAIQSQIGTKFGTGVALGMGYGGGYNAIESAVQGKAAGKVAEDFVKGMAGGGLTAAPFMAAGSAWDKLLFVRNMKKLNEAIAKAAREDELRMEAAKEAVKNLDPSLSDVEVSRLAQRTLKGETPDEAVNNFRQQYEAMRGQKLAEKQATEDAMRAVYEADVAQRMAEYRRARQQISLPPGMPGRRQLELQRAREIAEIEKAGPIPPEAPPGLSQERIDRAAAEASVRRPSELDPVRPFDDDEIRRAALGLPPETQQVIEERFNHVGNSVPEVPITERHKDVEFYGDPGLRPYVRATRGPLGKAQLQEDVKNEFLGLFEADPGVRQQVKDWFFWGRHNIRSSDTRANHEIQKRIMPFFGKTKREIYQTAAKVSDYLKTSDQVQRLRDLGGTGPGATSQVRWEELLKTLSDKYESQPEVLRAAAAVRTVLDEIWYRMFKLGYITEAQYRSNYLPMQRLNDIAVGLRQHAVGTPAGRVISAALRAETTQTIGETDIVKVLRASLSTLNRKEAEDRMFLELMKIPGVNRTAEFPVGAALPPTVGIYRPGRLMPGYAGATEVDHLMSAVQEYAGFQQVVQEGDIIMPRRIAQILNRFYETPDDSMLRRVATAYLRQLTVYNPTNRIQNIMGDTPTAAMYSLQHGYLPGFVRFQPRSMKAALKSIAAMPDELWERAEREGLTSSTMVQSFGGEALPAGLATASGARRNPLTRFNDLAYRISQASETTPRIAAGLAADEAALKSGRWVRLVKEPDGSYRALTPDEAVNYGNQPHVDVPSGELGQLRSSTDPNKFFVPHEYTPPLSPFAEAGAKASLAYGAGDPQFSRRKVATFLAPFWKWNGLAAARLVHASGSPVIAPGIALFPWTTALWNVQNDEFRKVEYSLPRYERMRMHMILMDQNTGGVLRDQHGDPVIWTMRWYLPDAVASFFGFGNLAGRTIDVLSRYTTPGEFASETGSEFLANVAALPAPITAPIQLATGRSALTGEEMEREERLTNVLPTVWMARKFKNVQANYGTEEAIKQTAGRLVGVHVASQGSRDIDAKLRLLKGQISDARSRRRAANKRGDKAGVERFEKKIRALSERAKRLRRQARLPEEAEDGGSDATP